MYRTGPCQVSGNTPFIQRHGRAWSAEQDLVDQQRDQQRHRYGGEGAEDGDQVGRDQFARVLRDHLDYFRPGVDFGANVRDWVRFGVHPQIVSKGRTRPDLIREPINIDRGTVLLRWIFCIALVASVSLAVAGSGEVTLDGKAVQGGLMFGSALPGSKVKQDGKALRVSSAGNFLLGFTRDAPASSNLEVILPDGRVHKQTLQVAARDYRIQRIDGLPPGKVTPRKPEDLARIRRDAADVGKARARDDDRQDFLGGFNWPVHGPITGVYGSQRVLNGKPRRPHFGVDVAAPVGTPVKAPAAGIVTLAVPDMFFSGGTMIIDHGHKLTSSFLHLHKLHARVGDRVEQGDVVAEVGATGRVTGAHLDWRMNLRDRRIDPELLVPPMPDLSSN